MTLNKEYNLCIHIAGKMGLNALVLHLSTVLHHVNMEHTFLSFCFLPPWEFIRWLYVYLSIFDVDMYEKVENYAFQNTKNSLGDFFQHAAKPGCPFRNNSRVHSGLNTVHALQSHMLVLFTPKAKKAKSCDSCMSLNHPPGPSDETALSSIVSFALAQCPPWGLYNPFNRI